MIYHSRQALPRDAILNQFNEINKVTVLMEMARVLQSSRVKRGTNSQSSLDKEVNPERQEQHRTESFRQPKL
jgi:hypothetical protein